jgi:hypothetical protein
MSLRLAVWLLLAQVGGLAAAVALLVVEDLRANAASLRAAVAVTVFAAMLAAVLAWLARALSAHRRFALGPAVVLELVFALVGYTLATSGLVVAGLVVMALGTGGVLLLLARPTRAALGRDGGPSA